MKSHEVIKESIDKLGAKKVASELGISLSLLYKWSEPSEESGAANPLDRVADLCRATQDARPIGWLCQTQDGVFVKNPPPNPKIERVDVLRETQRILREFSDVLNAVSDGWEDSRLTRDEAEKIRAEWDELKAVAETFVRSCEAHSLQKTGPEKAGPEKSGQPRR